MCFLFIEIRFVSLFRFCFRFQLEFLFPNRTSSSNDINPTTIYIYLSIAMYNMYALSFHLYHCTTLKLDPTFLLELISHVH